MLEEKPYHHGDLRRGLLDAALRVIAEGGVAGLTLREVARQAGVSHNAPYHHFADKAALVAALVDEGFTQFAQTMQFAYDAAEGSALDKMVCIGVAYVQFAMNHPAQFRLMFRPELRASDQCLPLQAHKTYETSSGFDVVIRALQAAQREGLVAEGDTEHLALAAWSTVHGLADLILDGNRNIASTTEEALALARVTVEIMVQGLAKRP
ncbi:MAG: TetR/AcrR family transcriptional regulator [Ktedonobacterales bacterium]|nr:TetR/AcrR family transcriptional regulator [Ktedonobacterales bacterium]